MILNTAAALARFCASTCGVHGQEDQEEIHMWSAVNISGLKVVAGRIVKAIPGKNAGYKMVRTWTVEKDGVDCGSFSSEEDAIDCAFRIVKQAEIPADVRAEATALHDKWAAARGW